MFVLITLSVGMAARGGREMLLTACHGAIAFTVAADTPAFDCKKSMRCRGNFPLPGGVA